MYCIEAHANARTRECGFDPCDGYYRSHGTAVEQSLLVIRMNMHTKKLKYNR